MKEIIEIIFNSLENENYVVIKHNNFSYEERGYDIDILCESIPTIRDKIRLDPINPYPPVTINLILYLHQIRKVFVCHLYLEHLNLFQKGPAYLGWVNIRLSGRLN